MIEVKLSNIVNNINKLQQISNLKLNARAAFRLGKLLREIQREFNEFEEVRLKTIKQYAELEEDGKFKTNDKGEVIFPDEGSQQQCLNEINILLNSTVTLNAEKILLEDLDKLEFTPGQILELEDYIKE